MNSRGQRSGFSLIELMVVLVLIGILTALIIPEMKGTYEEALLRSTGRKLVDVCQLASSHAITRSHAHRVRLDRKRGRYFIETTVQDREKGSGMVPARDIPGGEGEFDNRIALEIRMPGEDSAPAPDQGPGFASGDDLMNRSGEEGVTFYPDGTADGAEILLRDRAGFRLVLRINPITARVRIIDLGRE